MQHARHQLRLVPYQSQSLKTRRCESGAYHLCKPCESQRSIEVLHFSSSLPTYIWSGDEHFENNNRLYTCIVSCLVCLREQFQGCEFLMRLCVCILIVYFGIYACLKQIEPRVVSCLTLLRVKDMSTSRLT